jgi:hypothetical protein
MRVTLIAPPIAAADPLSRRVALQADFFRQRGHEVVIQVAAPPQQAPAELSSLIHPVPHHALETAGALGESDLYIFHCDGFYPLLEALAKIERGVALLYVHGPAAGETETSGLNRLLAYADLVITEGEPRQTLGAAADDLADVLRPLPVDAQTPAADYSIHWAEVVAQATAYLPNRPYPYGRLPSLAELHPPEQSTQPRPSPVEIDPQRALLAAELQELQTSAKIMQHDYVVRSRLPVIGPVLAWLRRNLTSHLREPYIDPTFQRQELFNRQVAQTLVQLAEQQANTIAQLTARLATLEEQLGQHPPSHDLPTADEDRTGRTPTAASHLQVPSNEPSA